MPAKKEPGQSSASCAIGLSVMKRQGARETTPERTSRYVGSVPEPEVMGSRWAALKRLQLFVMALDCLVALARTLFQLLYVHEMNVAPTIFKKPRRLQRARHH